MTQNLEKEISSSWEAVVNGVLQGLILNYINGLPYGIHYTAKSVIYADTSVLIATKDINELQIEAKTTLDCMSKWFLVNGLTLNIDKTNIV